MKLKVIKGAKGAEDVLTRVDPLDLSALPEAVVARTREVFGEGITPEQSVLRMLQDVRRDGDAAVRRYSRMLDGVELNDFKVTQEQIAEASA